MKFKERSFIANYIPPPPSDNRGLCSPPGALRQHNLYYPKVAIPAPHVPPGFPIGAHPRALRDTMRGCSRPSASASLGGRGTPCPPFRSFTPGIMFPDAVFSSSSITIRPTTSGFLNSQYYSSLSLQENCFPILLRYFFRYWKPQHIFHNVFPGGS